MIVTRRMLITPEIAQHFLQKSRNIRKYNPRTAKKYAREMAMGHWHDNGNSIAFDPEGYLVDGQHRLHAIIISGKSQWVTINENVEDVLGIDNTLRRTAAQTAGVSNRVAGFASMLLLTNGRHSGEMSPTEQHNFIEEHKAILTAITGISNKGVHPKRGLSNNCFPLNNNCSDLAICEAIADGILSIEDLEKFATCCNNGLPVEGVECSAPLMLRKQFQEGRPTEVGTYKKWSLDRGKEVEIYTCMVHNSIQAFAKGQKVKKRFDFSFDIFETIRLTALNSLDRLELKYGLK